MSWQFTANSPDEVSQVRKTWPKPKTAKVAGELFQMMQLLDVIAKAEWLQYPLCVTHTGDDAVPDFQMTASIRSIAVEMAMVTDRNLEHARIIQGKLPDPPAHFATSDICYPDTFAVALKQKRNPWARFVVTRLPVECRVWLESWNGEAEIPERITELFCVTLNNILDGPPIAGAPELAHAFPQPEIIQIEGYEREETRRDRKSWLEDAFWEHLAQPINPTLSISSFIRRDAGRMNRSDVVAAGFLVSALAPMGPTISEEQEIWIERVLAEVSDKTSILNGNQFRHGNEDWLVLWDRFGTPPCEVSIRAAALSERLATQWQPSSFSRIFIQDEHFFWQLMFTASGFVELASPRGAM